MIFDPNNLYYWMADIYANNKTDENKIVICNEGSSRSSKTWDAFHFIYTFCSHNQYLKRPLEIIILRRTLKNCRERAYADFKEFMTHIEAFDSDSVRSENSSPVYTLFGNQLKFIGLDDGAEAKGSDIVFVNEMLEVESESLIRGWKMRCRKLFIADWNPKYTDHWAFDWESSPFTYFSKTTYKNNKHLEKSIIADIESTSPWHLDDLHLQEKDRRRNEENFKNKTVDKWHFKVYGMGERANKEGLVFPDVTWIDEFPKDYERIGYAMDLGFTNSPSVLTKCTTEGHELYAECLIYEPTKDYHVMAKLLTALGITNEIIWCDSAHPLFISGLQQLGFKIFAIKKTPIMDGIGIIKSYSINLVRNVNVKKEQENYTMRTVNGISLDEPVKGNDHFWDALRYNCIANFRKHV